MSFDPDKFLAEEQSGFDPDAFLADDKPKKKEKFSKLGSATRGFVQDATFGFRDEAAGALKNPKGALKKALSYLGYNTTGDQDVDEYTAERDASRELDAEAYAENPWSYRGGKLAGVLVPGMGWAKLFKLGKGAGLLRNVVANAGMGGASAYGSSDKENLKGQTLDTILGTAFGAAGGYAGDKLSRLGRSGAAAKKGAEQLAENATGATALQLSRFKDGAGRELLDRGMVKLGDAADDIAERLGGELSHRGKAIEEGLEGFQSTVRKGDYVNALKSEREALKALGTEGGTVRQMNKIIKDVSAKEVPDDLSLTMLEQIKRRFQGQSNYTKPNTTAATKKAAFIARKMVEDVAENEAPEMAAKFADDKAVYELFAPVYEAAQRRGYQLQQHPFGGFLDTAALATGGPKAAILRRLMAPRLSSTGAVTLDALGNLLNKGEVPLDVAGKLLAPTVRGYSRSTRKPSTPWSAMLKE